jgi:hypothetical protein
MDSLRERLNLNRDYGMFQSLGLHVCPLSDAGIFSVFGSAITYGIAFDLHGWQIFSAWYDQSFMHDMYRFVC